MIEGIMRRMLPVIDLAWCREQCQAGSSFGVAKIIVADLLLHQSFLAGVNGSLFHWNDFGTCNQFNSSN